MNYEQMLKQGDSLAAQGKLDEAFTQYIQARDLDPVRPEAHKQIINLALKKEDFSSVFEEHLNWSDFLRLRGKLDEAAKTLLDAISLEGQHGRKSFLDRRSANSSRLREHFVKYSPKLYEALGEIYYEKKDYDHAIEYLDKAREVSLNNTKVYSLQGLSYLAKGQYDKAKGPFQEVVRFQGPESALAYEKLAEIYANQGNTTQMVIWLKDAANEYLKQNNDQMGIQAMERILEIEPSNKEILNKLAESYFKLGDTSNAVRVYKHLAEVYSQAGLFDKVIILYEKLTEWEPDNTEIITHLISIYKMALNVDPGNLRARLQLIQNLIKIGNTKEAISELFQLAENYVQVGLEEEAVTHYQKILELEPANTKAQERLSDIYEKTGKSPPKKTIPTPIEEKKIEESKTAEAARTQDSSKKENIKQEHTPDVQEKTKTAEAKTGDSEHLWQSAKTLYEKGQTSTAEEYLKKLLEVKPEHIDAKIMLVKVYETELLREVEEFSRISG
jgi:tetratricopeptide (TPR) repeat protein